MSKLPPIRRLRTDEFPSEYQDLTDKLVYGINQFFEPVYNALNKRLNFIDNFQALDVEVSFTAPISPNRTVSFKNDIGLPIRAVTIRRVDNNSNSDRLQAAPFVEFENGDSQVILVSSVGFTDGITYTIRLLCEP